VNAAVVGTALLLAGVILALELWAGTRAQAMAGLQRVDDLVVRDRGVPACRAAGPRRPDATSPGRAAP